MAHTTVVADGSFDFNGGVDSYSVSTVQSALTPHGLRRDRLAWLSNATTRGGCIMPRAGWLKLLDLLNSGLYQGGIMYETFDQTSDPRLIVSVSGHIYSILLDTPFTITDLSVKFGLFNPAAIDQAFFVEAEGILIIQAGDFGLVPVPTLPLIYRSPFGAQPEVMRRSNGLAGLLPPNPPATLKEIPAATCMVYYQDRVWYAQGRIVSAGDMVGDGGSGSAPYNFRDSVVKVTENPLAIGGDGFSVPSQAGNIRALAYTANLDTTLGQGPLYIFTRKQICALNPPVSRFDWIAAGNSGAAASTQPIRTVAQINNGAVGERCIVHVNGDLYYQSLTPDLRSLVIATRYFQQPGNVSISKNEIRALQFNDRSVMRLASGIEFDNRLLQGILPKLTPSGVVCQGLMPLNFDTVSTIDSREPPAFEGMWEGLDHLQVFTGDFGGRQRAFSVVVDRQDLSLDVWEITDFSFTENGDNRIEWYAEFPAWTWDKEFELKQLRGGEIWFDRVKGTVDITVQYRPDADPCWRNWFITSFCSVRNCAEDVNNPVCYPIGPNYRESYRWPIVLPEPPLPDCTTGRRPSNVGYQFQTKIIVKGFCRIRGHLVYGEFKDKALYEGLNCGQ